MRRSLRPSLLLLVCFLEDAVSAIEPTESTFNHVGFSSALNERPNIRETLILFPLSPERKTEEEDNFKEERVPSAAVEEGPRPLKRLMNVSTRKNYNQHPAEFHANAIQQDQPEFYSGATLPAWMTSHSLPSAPVEEADGRPSKRPLDINAPDKNNGHPEEVQVIRQSPSSISHSGSTLPTWMTSTRSKKPDLPQHQHPDSESSPVLQNNPPASHPLPSIPESSYQKSKGTKLSLKRKSTTPKDFPLLNGGSGSATDKSLPPHPFQHRTIEDQTWSELRDSMQLNTDHSCQILNWTPHVINPKAALVSHFMANEFLKSISSFSVRSTLQSMHGSHQILIPFVYGLMIKPLTVESWARIVLVWRNFWYDKSGKLLEPPAEVLRKFLWISDLISESVMPELFENALGRVEGAKLPNSLHLLTHEARIIKLLSDGRRQLDYITADQQQALLHMKAKLAEENIHKIQEADLPENQILSSSRVMTILNRLKQKTRLINPPHSDMENIRERIHKESASFWDENLWVHYINPRNPLAMFGTMGTLPHLTGCPVDFKTKLVEFFQILDFDPISFAKSPAGTNPWEMDNLLRMVDRRIKDINAGKLARPKGFLPEVLNTVFCEEYKALVTKKQVRSSNPVKIHLQV
ncbi:hypothetical protein PGTUg99_017436 [Puccinia graminis f. sp. tritici]|uniref:Uncharacterized protein n=1 Tax=Puccinia graminis f. sp. tritici TaxID=56615 RepID=A0A5B0RKD8_PUCGR|nr:hypothetical protein PGTUg99_017436 [Puccinia graminis f. sp. tritici]